MTFRLCFWTATVFCPVWAAENFPTPKQIEWIVSGRDHVLERRFESADSVFQSFIDTHPHHPSGYFYQAATLTVASRGCEVSQSDTTASWALSRAIDAAERYVAANPADRWASFFLGCSLGLEGTYLAHNGRYWSAFWKARRGVRILEQIVEVDSSFADAYLGLGVWRFWSSHAARNVIWLPFLEDTRAQGLDDLKRCMTQSVLSSSMAESMLVWAYIANEEFVSAERLASEAVGRHPSGRSMRWAKAEALKGLEMWPLAWVEFEAALNTFSLIERH